jgi:hypothetical protein
VYVAHSKGELAETTATLLAVCERRREEDQGRLSSGGEAGPGQETGTMTFDSVGFDIRARSWARKRGTRDDSHGRGEPRQYDRLSEAHNALRYLHAV